MKSPIFKIREKVWLYPGITSWHFVSVGKEVSGEIKHNFGKSRRGFGSIKVEVSVDKTIWNTSIFPDKKTGTYVLPIKAEVRKKESISVGKLLTYTLQINI